jgi:hypothetical protein
MWFFLLACPAPLSDTADSGEEVADVLTEVCAACEEECLSTDAPATAWAHVSGGVDYSEPPPSSGNHDPCWANWGWHDEEVPDENWVHNMEHGGVIFLHNCPAEDIPCRDAVDQLRQAVQELPHGTWLGSPYPAMDMPFAIVSWEHKQEMGCMDMEALTSFYLDHVDQGPESSTSAPPAGCME